MFLLFPRRIIFYDYFVLTLFSLLLPSFWASRGHRCLPFPLPPRYSLHFYRAYGRVQHSHCSLILIQYCSLTHCIRAVGLEEEVLISWRVSLSACHNASTSRNLWRLDLDRCTFHTYRLGTPVRKSTVLCRPLLYLVLLLLTK